MKQDKLNNLVEALESSIEGFTQLVSAVSTYDPSDMGNCEEEFDRLETYRDNIEHESGNILDMANNLVDYVDEYQIKDARNDANQYFSIDSLDDILKADFLKDYFLEMNFHELSEIFQNAEMYKDHETLLKHDPDYRL